MSAGSTATCARTSTPCPHIVDAAEAAIRAEGIEPVRTPIRGGTDGSRLSEMGLPTPNLFTGGHEYHSVREWASVQDMAAAAATIVRLAEVWTQGGRSSLRGVSAQGVSSLASLDGEIMPVAEAMIPATDEGLIRGDGVFEVVRVYDGQPFALEAHLARLRALGDNLRLEIDVEAVRADAQPAARARRTGRRPRAAADRAHARWSATAADRAAAGDSGPPAAEVRHLLADADPRRSQVALLRGQHARRSAGPRAGLRRGAAGHPARPRAGGADELDLLGRGRARSSRPPLDEHILASITRALVIEVAGAQERVCPLEQLLAADEVFIASTTREVQPVVAVDERSLRRRRGGDRAARRPPSASASAQSSPGEGPHRNRQPPAVHQGGGGLADAARAVHEELLVHTGQHFDDRLSAIFFAELGLPAPDEQLGVALGTNTSQTARMLTALEPVLEREAPDVVLVYGDTNSTLAGALAAAQAAIPVAHVEAGMRSFDRSMPEELNRVLVDHASALLLCSSEVAMANLRHEGVRGLTSWSAT